MKLAWLLSARIPKTGVVLAVVDDALTTIVEEPSKLPIVFPATVPISNVPVAEATTMPTQAHSFVQAQTGGFLIDQLIIKFKASATGGNEVNAAASQRLDALSNVAGDVKTTLLP